MAIEKKDIVKEKPSARDLEERVKYLELQVREVEAKLRLRDGQAKLKSVRI
jgi:hypothetical protein